MVVKISSELMTCGIVYWKSD